MDSKIIPGIYRFLVQEPKITYITENIVEINGKPLYYFNPSTGVLKVCAKKSDLELMADEIVFYPDSQTIKLSTPLYGRYAEFKDVKELESMKNGDDGYTLQYISNHMRGMKKMADFLKINPRNN